MFADPLIERIWQREVVTDTLIPHVQDVRAQRLEGEISRCRADILLALNAQFVQVRQVSRTNTEQLIRLQRCS